MRTKLFFIAHLLFWSVFLPICTATGNPQVEMVKRVMPAVVGIGVDRQSMSRYGFGNDQILKGLEQLYENEKKQFKQKKQRQTTDGKQVDPADIEIVGSGFLISPKGRVITAHHVVRGQRQVFVTTYDNQLYPAKVIISSPESDIAVLQLDTDKETFPFMEFGDSDALEIAEPVVAIGNPFGFTFTVTSGIISGLNRSFGTGVRGLIQTDTPINPGNSGGPLVNESGQVIGVSHAILSLAQEGRKSFAGLGFAVPINMAKSLLSAESKTGGKGQGRSQQVTLGIEIDNSFPGRVVVMAVTQNSPADGAGIQKGDLIKSADHQKITRSDDLIRHIRQKKTGDQIELKLERGKQTLTVNVTF